MLAYIYQMYSTRITLQQIYDLLRNLTSQVKFRHFQVLNCNICDVFKLEFELFHILIYLIYLTGIKNYKLSELTAISSGSKYVTLISNFDNLDSVTSTIGDITCTLASKS